MAVLNWNPLHPLENNTSLSFFLADIKHTAASWPLQALMAEVMSEAARKSVIAMIVEKLWRMLLSGAICDRWRAATIYWWQWKDPPTTTQAVRNHQCPSVCCHPQLTTSAHSTLAWTGGRGTRTFVFHQVVSLRGQRSNWEWHTVYLNGLWPGSFFLWTKQHEVEVIFGGICSLAYISSLLVRPVTLAACSPSVQAVNILLLSLFQAS